MQRNQFGATRKSKLLHGIVKASVSDISASFQTHLRADPTLDASGKRYLSLKHQIQGYKSVYTPTKHQKSIPANWVFRIYKEQYSHLITAIGQLITGAFFWGKRPCEYSTTPKGDHKRTHILRKRETKFYRKRRKIPHIRGCIQLADKVFPTLWTQKNGVKNATVTQWRTGKHLCPVQVWADIVTRLDSYPGSS